MGNTTCGLPEDKCILSPKGGMTMTTEARKRATKKYDAANTKGLHLKLNLKTDVDILDRLEAVADEEGGKQGYIKALIRRDIAQGMS